ncbi:hypothetical protein RDV89_20005 [Nocardioides zeae]|uniref:Uncharacterized protein n=1 Tax=Nocardioides imazamoxiresistens TaxID=3231893 RepID=A0ABU3Q1K5_9ACTN|nr:hypothetical protein [Nocardioides zeae]MDT9595378.1 hypothetical protein [Nocardioides zeae]
MSHLETDAAGRRGLPPEQRPASAADLARLAQWQVNVWGRALALGLLLGAIGSIGLFLVDQPGRLLPFVAALPVLTTVAVLAFARAPRL